MNPCTLCLKIIGLNSATSGLTWIEPFFRPLLIFVESYRLVSTSVSFSIIISSIITLWFILFFLQCTLYSIIRVRYWTLLISEKTRNNQRKDDRIPQKCCVKVARKCVKLEGRIMKSHSDTDSIGILKRKFPPCPVG